MQRVLVIDRNQQPLMPCLPARARELLHKGKAAVFLRYPFTIILTERIGGLLQPLQLKADPGSKTTGVSLVGRFKRGLVVLFALHLLHRRQEVREALLRRSQSRRGRRSRNTRYRAPRFNNRRRKEGWLPPSLQSLLNNILCWCSRLRKLCPITQLSFELVRFDTQALQNPEISGVEYQRGELFGFEIKEYLLLKFHHRCAYCSKGGIPLQVEHIIPRARGGTNRVWNLAISCEPCNQKKGTKTAEEFGHPQVQASAKASLKDAAAVNTIRLALYRNLLETGLPVETGTGGQTKYNRTRQVYPKVHWIDAACVGTSGQNVRLEPTTKILEITARRRGSRQQCRMDRYGFPRTAAKGKRAVFGFRTGDLVKVHVPSGKKAGRYTGRVAVRTSGSFNIQTEHGTIQGISYKHCKRLVRSNGYSFALRAPPVTTCLSVNGGVTSRSAAEVP